MPSHSTLWVYFSVLVLVLLLDVSVLCCFVDTKPRMDQLMMLKSATCKGDKVDIIETVAPDWKKIGILMNLDPIARKVKCIETDHAHKWNGCVICCQEIFRLWLDSPDVTWGNLIELLIDAEHTALAEQVKNVLGL